MIHRGLANSVKVRDLVHTNFDQYTKNVEAIVINPNWNIKKGAPSQKGFVTLDDFAELHFSKNLMIDGLVFVWVEKEIISQIIRILEK